jgi:hypothetical protein
MEDERVPDGEAHGPISAHQLLATLCGKDDASKMKANEEVLLLHVMD